MRQLTLLLGATALLIAFSTPGVAACFADYKAKRDDPLRLHFGTIKLEPKPCTKAAARKQIPDRIGKDGWELLNVLGVFDKDGLAERKESAGKFHLRY